MSIVTREHMYSTKVVDENEESDYIDTPFLQMELDTVSTFRISDAFQYRPDLISMKFFGTYHMGWLLCHHNNFIEPIMSFETGVVIDIPNLDEYYSFYNANARN